MLPAGVEAYVADLSGSDLVLTRIAVAGQVIPADEAVILKANVQNFNLVPTAVSHQPRGGIPVGYRFYFCISMPD